MKSNVQKLSKSSGEAEPPKQAETKSLGFTLIELLVSISIIGILSTFVLVKVNNQKQNLNRAAQRLALDIRKAQNLALAPTATPAPCLYGVNVPNAGSNLTNDKYFIYNRPICGNGNGGYQYGGVSNIIETINISSLYKGVMLTTASLNKDIAFEAPEPITYAKGNKNNSTTITLTCGACGSTKTITVNRFGMVQIQ